ncbi:MAG: DUF2142 domain-containing protein, partial [Ruminococcaceae bacterium]|nr:DUF2142 domain-containing protein [Oscillospiraceae bacterium]
MPASKKRKLILKYSVTVVIILFLATMAEFAYCFVKQANVPETYNRLAIPSSDFNYYEYRSDKNEDNIFFSLANDSYFEVSIPGGIAAQSIDIYLYRDGDDKTESVIYFTGKSNGVEGTFVAGMNIVSDGVFRAFSDFDRVDSLKIFPTEKTNSKIIFDGIEFNAKIRDFSFSYCRLLLWIYIISAVYFIGKILYKKYLGIPPRRIWLKVYVILGAVLLSFLFLATGLYSTAKNLGDIVYPLGILFYSLVFWSVCIVFTKIKMLHNRAFVLFLAVGISFCLASAPLQAPDEGNHFARSYAISSGIFTFDGNQDYPKNLDILFDSFPGCLNMLVNEYSHPTARKLLSDYLNGRLNYSGGKAASNMQLILPYLPSAALISVPRILGTDPLILMYIGRFGNLLFVAFCLRFMLKKAVRNIGALLTLGFFPLTIYLSASLSYDAMLLGAIMIFLGILQSKIIASRDLALSAVAFSTAVMIKPVYLLLLFFLIAVPRGDLDSKFKNKKLLILSAFFALGVLTWYLSLYAAQLLRVDMQQAATLPWVDKGAQFLNIIKNPLRFLAIVFVDGFRNMFYIGDFG